ncbi:MAG: hypothetical protein ACI3XL_01590 [Eubacteriales bacterium]
MDGYLSWFFAFMTSMLIDGVWRIFYNLFLGIVQIFNLPVYIDQLLMYKNQFGALDWVFCVLSIILVYGVWAIIIFLIILAIRKYVRFRRSLVGNEDLLEEIADLHRDVIRLTQEKERIMALKVGQTGISMEQLNGIFDEETRQVQGSAPAGASGKDVKPDDPNAKRFFRLSGVDDKYEYLTPPEYVEGMTLEEICDDIRNFACSKMHLYYEKKTIRLMFAGLASTKLIILQGISGTGKTSLPYCMGKYFKSDATISAVQPSWRDRSELFGYFNEFTKKFNETEVLKRIYEASYNDDINIIVLDEMNIARVEYYFAEMLSVLEMPDPSEWKLNLVTATWPNDPKHLENGNLSIPQNVWYIGTANNDDSTFAVSDKVYDRALVINLDTKGVAFEAPVTESKSISYSYVADLYEKAIEQYPVSEENHDKIQKLDMYVIQKFRVAFGNRIIKQLDKFVPVYVACGGDEIEAIDYLLATKVFRKFESLNLSLIRDEIKGLKDYLDTLFGKGRMEVCIEYLNRLQKMY